MRRYSQVFVVVALFCFLFPFVVITPAKNAGALQMTGWEMLTTKNIGVSKQPPVVLHIPLRVPILLALLSGAAGILVGLTKRNDIAWVGVGITIVAAISLCTVTTSSLPVQLTDGQNVLYQFDDPPVQRLPAFYVSLGLMAAAVVSSLLNLRKAPGLQSAAAVASRPAVTPFVFSPAMRASSFCIKCGGGLAAGARFCNRCGSIVATASIAPKPVESSVPPIQQVPVRQGSNIAATAAAPAVSPLVPSAPSLRPTIPAAGPLRVAFPQPIPVPAARSALSPGAKLGFSAAALIFGVVIWIAVRPSTNHDASMRVTAISISPETIRVVPGGTTRVMALVSGEDRDVQWSVLEGASGGSIEPGGATVQNGTVFLLGNYHAPYAPGVYHVIAVNPADPTRKATAQVVVGYGTSGRF